MVFLSVALPIILTSSANSFTELLTYSGRLFINPRNTFSSVVYSQGLRYTRIINDNIKLFRKLDELKRCFLNSGYPKKLVENIFDDLVKRPRNLNYNKKTINPPNEVLWVQTFSPDTIPIKKNVKEANSLLQQSPVWSNNKRVIGVVNRRSQNLGDLLLKRKHFALTADHNDSGTKRCNPLINMKEKRGRPCSTCPLISNESYIKSSATGKVFRLPEGNCKSRKIVYCAECFLM